MCDYRHRNEHTVVFVFLCMFANVLHMFAQREASLLCGHRGVGRSFRQAAGFRKAAVKVIRGPFDHVEGIIVLKFLVFGSGYCDNSMRGTGWRCHKRGTQAT